MPSTHCFPLTNPGRRRNNEDYVAYFEPTDSQELKTSGSLYIVADGVGGAARGERASQFATQKVLFDYFEHPQAGLDPGERLRQAMETANQEIFAYAEENYTRMATTMVAAAILGNSLYVANVGDSRAYLIRDGVATQITRDHSMVEEMVRHGEMTAAEARASRNKNRITRSLGGEPRVSVDVFPPIALKVGDKLLLCSDGLTRYALPEDLVAMTAEGTPEDVAQRLVSFALQRGAADNVSVLPVFYLGVDPSAPTVRIPRPRDIDWETLATDQGLDRKGRGTRRRKSGLARYGLWAALTLALLVVGGVTVYIVFSHGFSAPTAQPSPVAVPQEGPVPNEDPAETSPPSTVPEPPSIAGNGLGGEWLQALEPISVGSVERLTRHEFLVAARPFAAFAFGPDGRTLATASNDQFIRVWDLATGGEHKTLNSGEATFTIVRFVPGQNTLVSGEADGTVRLWQMDSPGSGDFEELFKQQRAVVSLDAFISTRTRKPVVVASDGVTIVLWDPWLRPEAPEKIYVSSQAVDLVVFTQDGNRVAHFSDFGDPGSGTHVPVVDLWNWDNRDEGYFYETGNSYTDPDAFIITGIAFSQDGASVAFAGPGSSVWLAGVEDPQEESKRRDPPLEPLPDPLGAGFRGTVTALAFSPDGSLLAAGDDTGKVHVWNVGERKYSHALEAHAGELLALAFSPDGKLLASAGADGKLVLWYAGEQTISGGADEEASTEPVSPPPPDSEPKMKVMANCPYPRGLNIRRIAGKWDKDNKEIDMLGSVLVEEVILTGKTQRAIYDYDENDQPLFETWLEIEFQDVEGNDLTGWIILDPCLTIDQHVREELGLTE